MKTKKKSGKTLRKSEKSQGKIREFDGIKKVGTLTRGGGVCIQGEGSASEVLLYQMLLLTLDPQILRLLIKLI